MLRILLSLQDEDLSVYPLTGSPSFWSGPNWLAPALSPQSQHSRKPKASATVSKADSVTHADGKAPLGGPVTLTRPRRSESESSGSIQPGIVGVGGVDAAVVSGSEEAGSCEEAAESSESSSASGSSDTDVTPLEAHLRE
jgi:hypothetical protein